MRRLRAVPFIIALIIILGAIVMLGRRPGTVSVEWLGNRIDAPFWLVAVGLVLLVAVCVFLWQVWRWLLRAPGRLGHARAESRRHRGYKALTQGLVAVAAGDAEEARRQARIAGAMLREPPLTLLLEAQAAQLSGDEQAAAKYFRTMLGKPETAFLGVRGLLTQALKADNESEALALARRAAAEQPKAEWAVSTLLELELKAGAWTAAEATLRRAEKLGAIELAAAQRLRAVLLTARARSSEKDGAAAGRRHDAVADLRAAIKLAPDLVPARVFLAEALMTAGRQREAGKIIEQGWQTGPHADLATAYARLESGEMPLARVRRFERLTRANPTHLESQVALGAANLAAGLWGPARSALEAAIAVTGAPPKTPQRLARLMARLEEEEGNDSAAVRRWLVAAAEAPADPAWICDKCGATAMVWMARCGNCGAFDGLRWRAPHRMAVPLPAGADGRAADRSSAALTMAAPEAASGAALLPPAGGDDGEGAPVDAARRVN